VYVLLEAPGNAAIWLASVADRVFLVPTGQLGMVGVGVELTFYGEALSRLGIEPDFAAAGAYKSFGEPYTRTYASAASQEAVRSLIDDVHGQLTGGLAEARGLEEEVVQELLARAPLLAQEALDAGLVDQLAYFDEVKDWIEARHGSDAKFQRFAAWARRDAWIHWLEGWGDGDRQIVVLHLQGPIVMDDRSPMPMIRARAVVPALRDLRENDDVHAVVLHVSSGGGSALASDLIWREVDKLSREKPVVASFEDVAASGGYYLSAPAAEILARSGTLTGSIGVFGGKLVMQGAMRQVGVHTQQVLAAPNAAVFSATRPFDEGQRARFQESLQHFYDGFVERVATGRNETIESLEPHCRGRVWTGASALERKLVDREGDLFDAVERARVLSGLHVGGFQPRYLTAGPPQTLVAKLVQAAMREMRPRMGSAAVFRGLERLAARLVSPRMQVLLDHPGEPLAMMPFEVEVH
jgi:protease-4